MGGDGGDGVESGGDGVNTAKNDIVCEQLEQKR